MPILPYKLGTTNVLLTSRAVIIVNNRSIKALMALYKQRWEIELFFKWYQAEPAYQAIYGDI